MRLIDADALIKRIEDNSYLISQRNNSVEKGMTLVGIKQCIDEEQFIDAEPVRHGEWILTKERNIWDQFTEVLKCSECGKFASRGQGIEVRHRYCPNCGAKMDGEREVLE